ncbi:MAG TPA: GNAT family N-acetyltransferase [Methylomirabilota bacterium]|nr:GNAT family N-acetyltransferase [Methylomirabilota bacterium]
MKYDIEKIDNLRGNKGIDRDTIWNTAVDLSNSAEEIVPVTRHDIYLGSIRAYIALTKDRQFAGLVRAKRTPYYHQPPVKAYWQIGTLVVPKIYQGNGIATDLVKAITEDMVNNPSMSNPNLFAFVSDQSVKAFEANNYVPAVAGELPSPAKSQCGNPAVIRRADA